MTTITPAAATAAGAMPIPAARQHVHSKPVRATRKSASVDVRAPARPSAHVKLLGGKAPAQRSPFFLRVDCHASAETIFASWRQLQEALAAGQSLVAESRQVLLDDAGMHVVPEGETFVILGVTKEPKYGIGYVKLRSADGKSEPRFRDGSPVDGLADGVFEYDWLTFQKNFASIHPAGHGLKDVAAPNPGLSADQIANIKTALAEVENLGSAPRAELIVRLRAVLAPSGVELRQGTGTLADYNNGRPYIQIDRLLPTEDILDAVRHELTHVELMPLQMAQRMVAGPFGDMWSEAQADYGAGAMAGMKGQLPTGLLDVVMREPGDPIHGIPQVRAARALMGAWMGAANPWLRLLPGVHI